jgi:multicomponent Na+:H+ antiporter subunit E
MSLFLVNVLLALLWVLLWDDLSVYTIVIGFVFGYATLYLFTRFSSGRTLRNAYGQRLIDLFVFAVKFTILLIRSNLEIAWEILTPGYGMTPRIIRYEVTGMTETQVAAFSNAITLTPGTLVVDVRDSAGGRLHLYVHCLYAGDRDQAVRDLDELRLLMNRRVFR